MSSSLVARWRKKVLGISAEETSFAKRGFRPTDPGRQRQLERVGRTFVDGYHTALEETRPEKLSRRLDQEELVWQGFAYEGAAMALALLDSLALWERGPWPGARWRAFLEGPGEAHAYMVHVGAGWAAARVPWVRRGLQPRLESLDPLLRWLVVDGYGFHEGFFHWDRLRDGESVPDGLSGYARRAFDQGLGRCLWFIEGADVSQVVATIGRFSPGRQADLFGGIGLACAYAGGVENGDIEHLARAAGAHRPALAQGAAFAAKARRRAGNPAPQTELACRALWGKSADEAAAITDQTLADLPTDSKPTGENRPPSCSKTPAAVAEQYELWRQRIQQRLAAG